VYHVTYEIITVNFRKLRGGRKQLTEEIEMYIDNGTDPDLYRTKIERYVDVDYAGKFEDYEDSADYVRCKPVVVEVIA